jgi:hypothetical protein
MLMSQIPDYNSRLAVKDSVFTPINGVSLDDGLFKTVFENNLQYLKQFHLGDLTYWFDIKAGKPTTGKPFRGHFEDNLKGQTAFMVLMGAGNALRWIEDEKLDDICQHLLDTIEDTAESDGYAMAIPKSQFPSWEYPHYVRIWLTYGLLATSLSGHGQGLRILGKWEKWFNQNPELPIIKYLDLAYQGIVASTACYTSPIGTPKDLEVVQKYYEEDWRLAQFLHREKNCVQTRNQPGYEPHPHGSELESFEGYLDMYRSTGAYYYLQAVLGALELYKKYWQHVGGGIVMCEFLEAEPGCNFLTPKKPYNELCCSSFWLHINQRMHRIFPEEESYTAEIEKSLYNIAFANQDGTEGIRYFAHLEGNKSKGDINSCCSGVGTRIFGSLPEYIYSISEDDVYVDLFASSTLTWKRKEGDVEIKMTTSMPYDSQVVLQVKGESFQAFHLHIRVPYWATGEYCIHSGEDKIRAVAGSYCCIEVTGEREFHFIIPMGFRSHKYTGVEEVVGYDRYCLEYGPLLMAFTGKAEYKYSTIQSILMEGYNPLKPEDWLTRSPETLNWEIIGKEGTLLVPYFSISEELFVTYPLFK